MKQELFLPVLDIGSGETGSINKNSNNITNKNGTVIITNNKNNYDVSCTTAASNNVC